MEQKKYIDLHTHSTYSDGTLTPLELVKMAKKNLSAMALTDHDTTDGLPEAIAAGKQHGVLVIPGIELGAMSETYNHTEIHIVGLGIQYDSKPLQEQLDKIQKARTDRNLKMLQKLSDYKMPISYDELKKAAGGEIITRAHYAKVMEEKGYVKNKKQAFSDYISQGCPCYIERDFLTPKDCIKAILASGGQAVLAHPTLYSFSDWQLESLCGELLSYGLGAIETMYSTYTQKQQKKMQKLAQKLSLHQSGGSDFHGANKPDIALGTGLGNLKIPFSFLEEMLPHACFID